MENLHVITAPRQPYYLGEMMRHLPTQMKITLHREPGCPLFFGHSRCVKIDNPFRRGVVMNWLTTLGHAYVNDSSDWLLIAEDDVAWNGILVERTNALLKTLDPESVAFVSPYASVKNVFSRSRGWHEARMTKYGWCGALTMLVSRPHARWIIENEETFKQFALNRTEKLIHLDYAIGRSAQHNVKKIWTHNPSLVRHLGDVSTFEANNTKEARNHVSRQAAGFGC